MKKARSRKLHYVDVLPSEPIPAGSYLVHNHIRPVKPLGLNGFRAWIQTDADNLVKCRCNFGGCKNSKLHRLHYRVGTHQPTAKAPRRSMTPAVARLGAPRGNDIKRWINCYTSNEATKHDKVGG